MIRTTLICGLMAAAGLVAQPRGGFGPPPEGRGMPGPMMGRMLGAEAGMPGRVVKNAPYTADVLTETTQTLADGNHIKQTVTVHVARDSEGRTRREQSLSNTLNGLAPNSNLPQVVFISDPVAGASYALNTRDKTATRSAWLAGRGQGRGAGQGLGQGQGPGGGPRAMMRQPPPDSPDAVAGRGMRRGGQNPNLKTEALGRQTIEGVVADGRRTTMTILAGQIGNDQTIQIVTESWYSPDLQTEVLVKRSDPRRGDTVVRLANVSRAEPPRTLFDVPSDFKVSDNTRGPGMRGQAQ